MKFFYFFLLLLFTNQIIAQDIEQCISNASEKWQAKHPIENLSDEIRADISESNLILSGEIHTIWESIHLRFDIFESLVKTHGFTHLVIEGGASRGLFLDQYLKTGEQQYLDLAFPTKGELALEKRKTISKEGLDRLKALNETLPFGKRVNIIGVDIERHGLDMIPTALKWIRANFFHNGNVERAIEELDSMVEKAKNYTQLKKPFKVWYTSTDIESILENEHDPSIWLLAGIIKGLKYKLDKKPYRQRDQFMYQRLASYHKGRKIPSKYYFQIGVNHLKTGKNWFANYVLNDESIVADLNPKLIRFEYFGFKKNIFGSKFKKGELSKFKLESTQINAILKENQMVIFPAQQCQSDSKIDYHLLIKKT